MAGYLCILTCSMFIYCCDHSEMVTDIVEPGEAKGAVIFLHGAGQSGPEARKTVEDLMEGFSKYPNLRVIFPTAAPTTMKPFPWNGQLTNTWFDIEELDLDARENVTDIDKSAAQIAEWVEKQVASGIPRKKICVVGYSCGGVMAIHYGYEYAKELGCIGAISGYLPRTSALYQKLKIQQNEIASDLPPLYVASGKLDFMIPNSWSEDTAEAFESSGVVVTRNVQWEKTHLMARSDILGLFEFIQRNIF